MRSSKLPLIPSKTKYPLGKHANNLMPKKTSLGMGSEPNVRALAPPLFSIELGRQLQPLIFPPIQAPNGTLRSVKHERRNRVIRVRGCKMTKIQESALRMLNDCFRPNSSVAAVLISLELFIIDSTSTWYHIISRLFSYGTREGIGYVREQICTLSPLQKDRSPSGHRQRTWLQESKHHRSALCPLLHFRRSPPVRFAGPSRRQLAREGISLATDRCGCDASPRSAAQ